MAPSMRTTQHSHCNTLYAYSVDSVLGGAQGLLRGEVTELIGPSASGKTQVIIMHTSHCSHSIVVWLARPQLPSREGREVGPSREGSCGLASQTNSIVAKVRRLKVKGNE